MSDDLLIGFEDALIKQNVAERYASAKKADASAVYELLNKELTKFPKGNCWWNPPKNIALNSALMGANLWSFSLLPFRPNLRAYRKAMGRFPEGIVLHPGWHPFNNKTYPDSSLEVMTKMVELVKSFDTTLQDLVTEQIKWIETKFGIKVPAEIEATLKVGVVKMATRRWGINHLKTKDTLIPFDGSKAIELGAFD